MTVKGLTPRQAELLAEIRAHGFDVGEWFRPMDVGGRSGSDHSRVLTELVDKGELESRWRAGPGAKFARGSKVYRLPCQLRDQG
ncbi:MAG: hypothetical protein JO214_02370 [Frankiaceae bacterium]|nr:hypothetical protein [Frankiaceae bacterium]